MTELLAFPCIFHRQIERSFGKPQADGCHHRTGIIQNINDIFETQTPVADNVIRKNDNVLERHAGGVGKPLSELILGFTDDDFTAGGNADFTGCVADIGDIV